jgi:hypothetical protein
MVQKLTGEVWESLEFKGWKDRKRRYAVSSHGRVASYKTTMETDGKLLIGSLTTGYATLNLHHEKKNGTLYVHREIARLFLKKPSAKHKYVIHLNHDKLDNHFGNLKWATLEEMLEHQQKSPSKIAYKEIQATKNVGQKLNVSKVKAIKKILANKSRKITIAKIAEKYDVSQMAIYRIKRGENWGRIQVEN